MKPSCAEEEEDAPGSETLNPDSEALHPNSEASCCGESSRRRFRSLLALSDASSGDESGKQAQTPAPGNQTLREGAIMMMDSWSRTQFT
jgi:hypothetical protein